MSAREANSKQEKRSSRYNELIHIDADAQEVVNSLFNGKPKPRDQWRYLKENRERRRKG